jgi:DNA-binding MarR family transcriptional regulator
MTSTFAPAAHPSSTDDGAPSLAHEVERLLTAGIGITARAIEQTPEAKDLTLLQWRVLVVAAEPAGIRIGELAAHLGVSVPSASRLVRRVEARELVTATRDAGDRRVTTVAVSTRGRRLVDAVVRARRTLIRRALADITIHGETPLHRDREATALVGLLADGLEALA